MEKIIFLTFLFLLVLPLISAETYGTNAYGCGLYGEGCSDDDVSTGGGGGGGGLECTQDSNCDENQYCFQNSCYDAECTDDSVCNVGEGEVCWELRCVKLFDVKIIDFESPIVLGDFFDFTYFVKGMAEVNGDVIINFRIEQNGSVVSSGYDVVYFGSFEEKTETTSLFMPSDTRSGTYEFIVEVNLGTYFAQSSRTVEISVDGGVATLRLFDISFSLEDSVIESSDELSGIVTFESFGNVPTPVDLTFIILALDGHDSGEPDEDGSEVYRGEETIVVETEEVLRKSFRGLDLSTGKYTVVLQTLYNTDVSDEFRQEFEIISGFGKYLHYGLIGIAILFVVLLIVFITWFILRKKIKIQIGQRVVTRIRKSRVNMEARRNKRKLEGLRRKKEREKIWKQKLRNKEERGKIRNLKKREKDKIVKERLVEKSKRKVEDKKTMMERILGRKRVLRVKKKVAWKEKRLNNRRMKETISGQKKLEKLKQERMKTDEINKKIKSLKKKRALLEKGYRSGYINEKLYKVDMKKINKLISGLRR